MNKGEIGKRLKYVREREGLTQRDFCHGLGINVATYSAYETGTNPMPLHVLDKLHENYNVSIDWLLGYSDMIHGTNVITRGDRFNLLLLLHRLGIVDINNVFFSDDVEDAVLIRINDVTSLKMIDDYRKMEALRADGTIDERLFSAWLFQQLEEMDREAATDGDNTTAPGQE